MRYEVILDSGETANKCTIAPLAYRPDFRLIGVTSVLALGPLSADVLLHHEGECLSKIRGSLGKVNGIASIDCVWRRLPGLLRRIECKLPTLVRIPDGFVTAYPRRSSRGTDPSGGLATIEAIFTASALLGRWDVSLFSEYYFGNAFLELNANRFLDLGVQQVLDPAELPTFSKSPKHSEQRRARRGRRVWGYY